MSRLFVLTDRDERLVMVHTEAYSKRNIVAVLAAVSHGSCSSRTLRRSVAVVNCLDDRVLVALGNQSGHNSICLMRRDVEADCRRDTKFCALRAIVVLAVIIHLGRIILRCIVGFRLRILNCTVLCTLSLCVLCSKSILGQGLAVFSIFTLCLLVLVQCVVDLRSRLIVLIARLRCLRVSGIIVPGIVIPGAAVPGVVVSGIIVSGVVVSGILLFLVRLAALELGQEALHISTDRCRKSHAVVLIIGVCLDEHVAVRIESSVHLHVRLGRSNIDCHCRTDCAVVRRSKTAGLCISLADRRRLYEDIRIGDFCIVIKLAVCHCLVGIDLGFACRIYSCIISDFCFDHIVDDAECHCRVNCCSVDSLAFAFFLDCNRICTGSRCRLTEITVHGIDQNAGALCGRTVQFSCRISIYNIQCEGRTYADVLVFFIRAAVAAAVLIAASVASALVLRAAALALIAAAALILIAAAGCCVLVLVGRAFLGSLGRCCCLFLVAADCLYDQLACRRKRFIV